MRIVAGLSVPEVGDVVTIEHDGYTTSGVVAAWYPNNQTAKVVFDNNPNKWLVVAVAFLGQGSQVQERHRSNDMDTARAAADMSPEALTEGQRLVLFALEAAGARGLIDHEHQRINGLIATSAGKRRLELKRQGLVEPTGQRRQTDTVRGEAAVWRLTVAGREVAASMRRRGVA